MPKPRLVATILIAVAFALSNAACSDAFGAQFSEAVHTHVPLALAVLHVENPVGRVTVQAWNRKDVQIDAVKRAGSADDVHAIDISVQPSGNRLDVTAQLGSNSNHRSVDFTIHAPASSDISIDASVGEVDVEGFVHNVDVDASVGKVTVAMARLGSGQSVTIQSSVGSIDLMLPHGSSAQINASTSVGSVGGDVGFNLERHTVGADGNVTIGSGGARVSLTTSTGSIKVNHE
jgi:hypothetical protein